MSAPRYIAVFGEEHFPSGDSDALQSQGLNPLSLGAGVHLWTSDHAIRIGEFGVIIGHLFTRSLPSVRVGGLTSEQAERIHKTSGASLMQDFWGGYVAVVRCEDGRILIIRDPSGAVPVFWKTDGKRLFVVSELGDVQLVSAIRSCIDPERLAAFLWAPHLIGAQTCLTGVRELLGGQKLMWRSGNCGVSEIWSPWEHVELAPASRRADHIVVLRETILDCIRAWGDCFSSIVLGLSGGLDSSIVAAGLRQSSACFRCLTMIGPGADGDERHYAGIVTGTYGLNVAHEHYRLEDIDPARGFLTHLPWPTGTLFAQGIAATHQRLAQEKPIDAIFTGNGGDMIFCSMHSVTPLVDLLRARAKPSALWRTAIDIADITGADVFTIFRKAIARAFKPNLHALPGGDKSFLNPELLARALDNAEPHPWLRPPAGILPGRTAHVAMIKRSQIGHEFYPRADGPVSVAPLLSQPIMELCLRIPSWEWTRGGIDRSAVRRAFHGALPAATLQRRSKGGPGGFMQQIYQKKSEQIRDILIDGGLQRLGIFDGKLLPTDLIATPGTASPVPARLMMLAAADSWVQAWPSR
jgi:asparagine synthase (glutamine-hydrolysing)|uniref:asparagine synthase (glutamine-hydrolyzing) n=1 Tax=uncultured Sphingobium sp. TaxID=316087 RepID=A0A8F8AJQ3_9SPHN|nr:asparagine synthase [uncultured Sphingobium sp.]